MVTGTEETMVQLDDLARDYVAMGICEAEDVRTCLKCGFSVMPWYIRCEACGDTSPFTPPEPPRWMCNLCGYDEHESEYDAEECCAGEE